MRGVSNVDVWECVLGFMDSQVLLASEELGVFKALDRGACSAAELAEECALPHNSAKCDMKRKRGVLSPVSVRKITNCAEGGITDSRIG